jgi:hypothetical protein
MEIVVASLVSHNVIIGKLDEENQMIRDAYALQPTPKQMPNGRPIMELSFIPFMFPISQKSVDIDMKHIVVQIPSPDDLKMKYLELTSNIVIPNADTVSKISNLKIN